MTIILYILKPWWSSWFTWLQCICKSKDNIFLFLAGINRCNFFLFFFLLISSGDSDPAFWNNCAAVSKCVLVFWMLSSLYIFLSQLNICWSAMWFFCLSPDWDTYLQSIPTDLLGRLCDVRLKLLWGFRADMLIYLLMLLALVLNTPLDCL